MPPAPVEQIELSGEYDSRDTGATIKIWAGCNPGELMMQIATNVPLPLRPTFRDAFTTPAGASIVFVRNATGKVVALSAGDDRVWDL